jgi:extradiol dioxygenase family protein
MIQSFFAALVFGVALGAPGQQAAQVSPPSIGQTTGSFFALLVPDAPASAKWYQEMLGFHSLRDSTGPGGKSRTIMLEAQGVIIEIIQIQESFAVNDVTERREDRLQGIKKIGIVISNESFDAVHRALKAKKVTFLGDVFQDQDLKMRTFVIKDNFGNRVQFFSNL